MTGSLLEAFAYPVRKNNAWILAAALAAFFLPQVLAWMLPISGWVVAVIHFLLAVTVALFLQAILESSMAGKASFPAWPEHSSPFGYAESVIELLGPYVVSFLPLIVLRCVYADFGDLGRQGFGVLAVCLSGPIPYAIPRTPEWVEPASWILAGAGVLYLPMALLMWSFFGGNAVLNPVLVIRNAMKAGGSYLLTAAGLGGLVAAWRLTSIAAAGLPWVGPLLTVLALLYFLCVAMRLVGMHYHANRDALQWERPR